ncbi:hypothetical protein DEO72_LG3g658 [Vigna unguiculata]|uniref:Uncharacterized protein n=1 Tax=Vigna unguiculata TaxID=3917 RepID=A0A4D6LC61_VIGUN|nr:hypothetical protein DEO72_LG3g657 [Vigna unguiculata]QCD86137.1 hypothetical protein DEO72_LG3g658 [Vigna unguiculata]
MVKLLAQIWSRCVCEVKWWPLLRSGLCADVVAGLRWPWWCAEQASRRRGGVRRICCRSWCGGGYWFMRRRKMVGGCHG